MLKIVKDSVLKVSRSLGYDIVPLREMKERDFALHLRELLTHLRIDCVLDVGANVGQYHDFLRDKVLYDGPIVSFEPVGGHVELLRERLNFDRPYLKLDTQGFDMEVLRGGRDSLPDVRALQTEASVIGIYKGMPGYMETIRYLDGCGFDVTGFYPVSRDRSLRLIEFDCVMMNRRATASGLQDLG